MPVATSDLTVKEFSELHGVGRSTVSLWCRDGTLKGAYQEDTPFGMVWYIPKATSDKFERPKRGRPRKPKAK
jgi:hypothetical protein